MERRRWASLATLALLMPSARYACLYASEGAAPDTMALANSSCLGVGVLPMCFPLRCRSRNGVHRSVELPLLDFLFLKQGVSGFEPPAFLSPCSTNQSIGKKCSFSAPRASEYLMPDCFVEPLPFESGCLPALAAIRLNCLPMPPLCLLLGILVFHNGRGVFLGVYGISLFHAQTSIL